jgi:UPF0271 protein
MSVWSWPSVREAIENGERMTIDINADAGESFGRWQLADEGSLFPHLTSVNLACGFHAGDPLTIRRSVALAHELGVAVGAHPGFADLAGFGRRNIDASAAEVEADVIYQLGALAAFLRVDGGSLHHVKAHGALYLRMMRDEVIAGAVARAVAAYDEDLPLVVLGGPGGELMAKAARQAGARVVTEAFPDRGYLANGQLAPRSMEGSLFDEPEAIAERAVAMALGRPLEAIDGGQVRVGGETLCLHGDNSNSAESAAAVRRALEAAGVEVRAF